ncbi:MAG: sorbosone dehydrogenase family protein [Bryobacterales bacterium]|nr:sorbosone dehydrogenase family protein [Bryobacterales bacterium]
MKRAVLFTLLLSASVYPQARKYTLPPPNPAGQVSNPAKVIPQPAGKTLTVPSGFKVEEYSTGYQKPRELLQLPGGAVLVTESVAKGGVFIVSNDKDRKPFIGGLDRPFGMAFHEGYLYVAEAEAISRFKIDLKAMTAGGAEKLVDLKGYGKGHWTRSLAIDAKAKKLYVSVGSGSNVDLGDPPNRNAVNVYNLDGSGAEIFATGLRNSVCIRFQPESKRLWTTVQERDGLGDEVAPDFFTEVRKGAFYGWPYAYAGPNEDPRHKGVNPEAVKKTVEPDVLLGPHVSAMNFVFYTGKSFPAKYRNGAFIALRGSSGRSKRTGYSIVFQAFKGGKPVGQPEPFLTGFMLGEDVREVWGRPVGLAQLADGSLLLSEDGNNKIWRISHAK